MRFSTSRVSIVLISSSGVKRVLDVVDEHEGGSTMFSPMMEFLSDVIGS